MGYWVRDRWEWVFRWKSVLSVEEVILLGKMLQAVEGKVSLNSSDAWSWNLDTSRVYSVKSVYAHLSCGVSEASSPNQNLVHVIARVWKSKAPSKVTSFAWQLLQDRLPTRLNLVRRSIIVDPGSVVCAFHGVVEESVEHIFFSRCVVVVPIWYFIARWLGWSFVPHSTILSHFEGFIGLGSSKRVGLGLLLVWLVVAWTVWNSRNDVIFAGGTLTVESIVDRVKFSF